MTLFTFRQGLYPFNFTLWRKGFYVFLRVGDHNFRLSLYGGKWKFEHEVMPLPDKVTDGDYEEYSQEL